MSFLVVALIAQTPEILLQQGHNAAALTMAYSRDGSLLVTSGYDRDIKVWQTHTGQLLAKLRAPQSTTDDTVSFVAINAKGDKVLSVSNDELLLWDLESGKAEKRLDKPAYSAYAFSKDGRVVGATARAGAAQVVDVFDKMVVAELKHPGIASISRLNVDGTFALLTHAGADDGTFIWDLDKREVSRKVSTYSGMGAELSPDGKHAAFFYGNYSDPRLFAPPAGKPYHQLQLQEKTTIKTVSLRADGTLLAAGTADGRLLLWDPSQTQPAADWKLGREICSLAFSPDGKRIAVALGGNGELRIYDVATAEALFAFTTHARSVSGLVFTPNGRFMVSSGTGQPLRMWDVHAGSLAQPIPTVASTASTAIDPSGALLAEGGGNRLRLIELKTGKVVREIEASGDIRKVTFSRDGKQVVTATEDSATAWWVASGKPRRDFKGFRSIEGIEVSSDGTKLALFGELGVNKRLAFFDFASGKLLKKLDQSASGSSSFMALNPSWTRVAVRTDSTLTLHDVTSGKPVVRLKDPPAWTFPVAFSPDGASVAAGSREGKVCSWNAETGEIEACFTQQADLTRAVAFSPDGKLLATAGDDTTIRLWRVAQKEPVANLIGLDDRDFIALTPDNYYRASRGALRLVSFRVGNKVFPFEQFDLRFNRPDILLDRLGYASRSLIDSHRHAYDKRLKKLGFTEAMLRGDFQLPEATIAKIEHAGGDAQLTVDAKDAKYKLDRFNLYVNDVPIYGAAGVTLRALGLSEMRKSVSVPLSSGRNKIQVSVLNDRGVESLRDTSIVVKDKATQKPKLWVVVVGVSAYKDAQYALRYAAKDAADLATLLESKRDRFSSMDVVRLLDGDATKERILSTRDALMRSSVDDQAVVFVAGHGLLDDALDYYFATADIDFDKPGLRGIGYDAIEGLLDGIPARKKLLLMDTCHSGEVDKETTALAPGVVVASNFRGIKRVQRLGLDASASLLEDIFADLRRGSGAMVISSAGGAEFALESSQLKNGVFTSALLDALRGPTGPKVTELLDAVGKKVLELTAGQQHPTARRENTELDYPLY